MTKSKLYLRSTLNFDGFPEYVASLGVNVPRLRKELGLREDVFKRQMNIVSWNSVCTFYERAAKAIGDESLGVRFALNAKANFSGIGPIIYLGAVSKDVPSFLKSVADYQSIRTNAVTYIVKEDFEKNELVGRYIIRSDSAPNRQYVEGNISLAALTARKLIPGFKVKYVSLTYKEPSSRTVYEEAFDAPVYFGAEENQLVSDMSYYDLQHDQLSVHFRDFALKAFFDKQTELKLGNKQSFSKYVKTVMPSIMGMGMSDNKTFAQSLNLHPKKLQRLLRDEGASFSGILNDTRTEVAHNLLANTDIPIIKIAKLLDYSSDGPFRVACERWFDMSPSHYRKLKANTLI